MKTQLKKNDSDFEYQMLYVVPINADGKVMTAKSRIMFVKLDNREILVNNEYYYEEGFYEVVHNMTNIDIPKYIVVCCNKVEEYSLLEL